MPGVAAIGVRPNFVPLFPKLNYSHPLATNMVFCGMPSLGLDLVKNRIASSFGTNQSAGAYGVSRQTTWSNAATTDMDGLLRMTIGVAYTKLGAPAGEERYAERRFYSSPSNNSGWSIGADFATVPRSRIDLYNNSGGSDTTVAVYAYHGTLVGGVDPTLSGVVNIYVNGKLEITTSTSNETIATTTANLVVGSSANPSIFCVWNRLISAPMVAMFSENPFCMLSY